jgi:hypothetical protein
MGIKYKTKKRNSQKLKAQEYIMLKHACDPLFSQLYNVPEDQKLVGDRVATLMYYVSYIS